MVGSVKLASLLYANLVIGTVLASSSLSMGDILRLQGRLYRSAQHEVVGKFITKYINEFDVKFSTVCALENNEEKQIFKREVTTGKYDVEDMINQKRSDKIFAKLDGVSFCEAVSEEVTVSEEKQMREEGYTNILEVDRFCESFSIE